MIHHAARGPAVSDRGRVNFPPPGAVTEKGNSCPSRTYLKTDHSWSGRALTSSPGTGTIMAISIKRAQQLAEDGELPVDEVIKTLYESEGVQGCRRVPHVGHPLQHV